MSRQRKKHKESVDRQKRRRAIRRMAAQWRWDHNYWGPNVYATINKWIWSRTIGKLLARGKDVLAQDSIMPRLIVTAEQTRVHRVHDDIVLTAEQIKESRRQLDEQPVTMTIATPDGPAIPAIVPVEKNWSVVHAIAGEDDE